MKVVYPATEWRTILNSEPKNNALQNIISMTTICLGLFVTLTKNYMI